MTFNPMACGAQCNRCPLGPDGPFASDDWRPVPPEDHGACILAVAESPGPDETRTGRPLSGRAGTEWNDALKACGLKRPDIDLDHVISCQPPGNSGGAWKRMNVRLDRLNKKRIAKGEAPWPTPEECCRPRLLHNASQYECILTLGKTATTALTSRTNGIRGMRGDMMMVDKDWRRTMDPKAQMRQVVPMMHPGFVMRAPAWRQPLQSDLGKSIRWFNNALRWAKPDVTYQPSPMALRDWLKQAAPFWVYDLETDGIEVETTRIRTIGIAIPDLKADGTAAMPGDKVAQVARAVVINLLSANKNYRQPAHDWNPCEAVPPQHFYSPGDEELIISLCQGALTDGRQWFGHNARSFDRQVVEAQWGFRPVNVDDTLFGARFRAPDLPKNLKTTGSILLDVERWETTEKGDKIVMGFDDEARAVYCGLDCVVNARIVPPLLAASRAAGALSPLPEALRPVGWASLRPFRGKEHHDTWTLYEVDHFCQEMCVSLRKNGVYVDQERRHELIEHYTKSVAARKVRLSNIVSFIDLDDDPEEKQTALRQQIGRAAADQALNPNAYGQIRELLYDIWHLGCPPGMETREFYTDTGLPGTGDAVLRAHLAGGNLTDEQADFIQELRLYRREQNKVLATTLLPLAMRKDGGIVWPDGRVRSNWNAHVTSVGRLSCSSMNLQNIGGRKGLSALKSIFTAAPGNYLIGCDLDQAHLKIIANIWQIPLLRECFLEGKDPHSLLAYAIFGQSFKTADGWQDIGGFSLVRKPRKGSKALAMREIAKTFRYASIYWAKPHTIWQVITSTETGGAPNEYLLDVHQRLKARLPYYDFDKSDIHLFYKMWQKTEPEWMEAWQDQLDTYQMYGHMRESVLGRRSGGLSDGKKNEVVNFPVLAAEGSVMRLAEAKLIQRFPFQGPLGPGMIHQCHDSVAIELKQPPGFDVRDWMSRCKDAKKAKVPMPSLPPGVEAMRASVEQCMNVVIPGWDIPITAEADVGYTLADV